MKKEHFLWLLPITAAIVIVLYLIGQPSHHVKHSVTTHKQKNMDEPRTSDDNPNQTEDTSSDSDNSEYINKAHNALIGHGFRTDLDTIDGVPAQEALNKFHLPPAVIHDSTKYYYFADDNTVLHTSLGSYAYGAKGHYTIDDTNVTVNYEGGATNKFPYHLYGNQIILDDTENKSDPTMEKTPHNYHFKTEEDPTAKQYIDSKKKDY
ncbi:hypothetical protein [Fructobacillus fructosus]|uniref:hypothetical protein n=1 Tax=Fructobacillus fructosus TaxID=1631 RepID=UPI002D86CFAE|nr:hypothetical protein R54866_LGPIEIPA_00996 [Fructobacillus fructosus]